VIAKRFSERGRIGQLAKEWGVVVATGVVALLAVSKVGEDVFAGESTTFDKGVQAWMLAHQTPFLHTFFLWVTRVGGLSGMTVLALGAGAYLWRLHERRLAAIVLLAPAIAAGAFSLVKTIYARPRPIGLGGIVPSSYSFPSGHATASTAICCTVAYIFWRERLLPRTTAWLIAVAVPLLIGVSRVYLNVHWATDVLGGWSGGVLLALLSVILYQRQRAVVSPGDALA
jgi:membrane-associated phospholipid phosphatase